MGCGCELVHEHQNDCVQWYVTRSVLVVPGLTGAGMMLGQWNVPHYPQDEQVQTLFLFTGLQNYASDPSIIQPVLQWGSSAAGNSKNWTIASWFVSSSHSSYSSLLGPVEPGDLIIGNMTLASNGDV